MAVFSATGKASGGQVVTFDNGKDIMRYCSYPAIGMSLSLAAALIGTKPTQAQSVGNKDARLSLVAASAPVQSPPITGRLRLAARHTNNVKMQAI